jgi:DNA repair protein RAD5
LSTGKRKKALETFNDPSKPCILVCSLKVAGVGLNLIKANRVYMMDTWWNEAIESKPQVGL